MHSLERNFDPRFVHITLQHLGRMIATTWQGVALQCAPTLGRVLLSNV